MLSITDKNHYSNVNVRPIIVYNDQDIIGVIIDCIRNNKKIRMVNSRYASSFVNTNFDADSVLVSMEKYSSESDLFFDHEQHTVCVNAGWKIDKLCAVLDSLNYSINTYSLVNNCYVMEICYTPLFSARLGASVLSDDIVGMRIIDHKLRIVEKNRSDLDFNDYLINYGLFGIVTHLTLKIYPKCDYTLKTSHFHHIFRRNESMVYKLQCHVVENYFSYLINKCIYPYHKYAEYNYCYLDYHNNVLMTIDLKEKMGSVYEPIYGADFLYTLDKILDDFPKKYWKIEYILKYTSRYARNQVLRNVEENGFRHIGKTFTNTKMNLVYMSYFIPVYNEEQGLMIEKFFDAIEFVANLVKDFVYKNKNYNIDLPTTIHFVSSSDLSQGSPIYNVQKNVYAMISVVSLMNKTLKQSKKTIRDLINFFSLVEKKWIELDGIPNINGMFGINSSLGTFQNLTNIEILNAETKDSWENKVPIIFSNHFWQQVLNMKS